jgi:hypothetical protein
MLRINEYGIEPGPYTYTGPDQQSSVVVVTDIVNYNFNINLDVAEALPVAFVVYRDLIRSMDGHRSYMVDINYFRRHFTKK